MISTFKTTTRPTYKTLQAAARAAKKRLTPSDVTYVRGTCINKEKNARRQSIKSFGGIRQYKRETRFYAADSHPF